MPDVVVPNPNPAATSQTVEGGNTIKFRANGADRELTIDEAKTFLSKAWAADQNMREAAELRKRADTDLKSAAGALAARTAADALRDNPGDTEALKTLAEFLGMDGDAAVRSMAGGPGASEVDLSEIPLERLPKELRALAKSLRDRDVIKEIDDIKATSNRGTLRQARDVFKNALTKDQLFGMVMGSAKGDAMFERMWDTIAGRVNAGENLTSVAQEVVEHYRDVFGVFDEAVSSRMPSLDVPGALGGAPGAATILGRLQPQAEPDFEQVREEATKRGKPKDAVSDFLRAVFGGRGGQPAQYEPVYE